VCNLYSLTPKQEHVGLFVRIGHNCMPAFEPEHMFFPNYNAPIVRRGPAAPDTGAFLTVVGGAGHCHGRCMIEKASAAGWVVQVTIPAPHASPSETAVKWIGRAWPSAPSFQYYNVAVATPEGAT
jgi:hypothetical protein